MSPPVEMAKSQAVYLRIPFLGSVTFRSGYIPISPIFRSIKFRNVHFHSSISRYADFRNIKTPHIVCIDVLRVCCDSAVAYSILYNKLGKGKTKVPGEKSGIWCHSTTRLVVFHNTRRHKISPPCSMLYWRCFLTKIIWAAASILDLPCGANLARNTWQVFSTSQTHSRSSCTNSTACVCFNVILLKNMDWWGEDAARREKDEEQAPFSNRGLVTVSVHIRWFSIHQHLHLVFQQDLELRHRPQLFSLEGHQPV